MTCYANVTNEPFLSRLKCRSNGTIFAKNTVKGAILIHCVNLWQVNIFRLQSLKASALRGSTRSDSLMVFTLEPLGVYRTGMVPIRASAEDVFCEKATRNLFSYSETTGPEVGFRTSSGTAHLLGISTEQTVELKGIEPSTS